MFCFMFSRCVLCPAKLCHAMVRHGMHFAQGIIAQTIRRYPSVNNSLYRECLTILHTIDGVHAARTLELHLRFNLGAGAMDWPEFIAQAENPSPGQQVVDAAIRWFTEELRATTPALAEGFLESAVESKLPSDIVVQACCRRLLRAVEAVAQAKRLQPSGTIGATSAMPSASGQGLASLLAPAKAVDVAALVDKASLKGLSFSLQAEQALWGSMQAHSEQCKAAGRKALPFIDLTSKEALPMWLTADQIGGKFHLRDDKEWSLQGGQAVSSLQDLSRTLNSATASTRFFRSVPQWIGAFLRYAVVAVATQQLAWVDVLAHVDVVMQLAEQERLKGRPPFLAFVYEKLMRRNWARRAEKGDPDLNISQEVQKIDKDVLDIARHRLTEVLKEAGLDGHDDSSQSSKVQHPAQVRPGALELVGR